MERGQLVRRRAGSLCPHTDLRRSQPSKALPSEVAVRDLHSALVASWASPGMGATTQPPSVAAPEQDVRGKRSSILYGHCFELHNHGSCVGDALLYIRLKPDPNRVVVRLVSFVLRFDEKRSKVLKLLAESSHFSLAAECIPCLPVVERAVRAQPRGRLARTALPDERIRAAPCQVVKESVVDSAHGAAEIGLQGTSPTRLELLLR